MKRKYGNETSIVQDALIHWNSSQKHFVFGDNRKYGDRGRNKSRGLLSSRPKSRAI